MLDTTTDADAASDMPKNLLEAEAAAYLHCSKVTLWRRRKDGSGPPFFRIGSTVLYPADGLTEWIRETSRANAKIA